MVRSGGQWPSFLLRRGELLHPSDLVQQLCDEVLEGEEHIIITRKDSNRRREVKRAELTSVGLKQSTSSSCEKKTTTTTTQQCESNNLCRFTTELRHHVPTHLDPGSPLYVTGHVQQLVHINLQLGDGFLLEIDKETHESSGMGKLWPNPACKT